MKYYSFYIGHKESSFTSWLFYDVKIPSTDVFRSIILWEYQEQLARTKKHINPYNQNFTPPNYYVVDVKYRKIIEYSRVLNYRRSTTNITYTKIRNIYPTDFLKHFRR